MLDFGNDPYEGEFPMVFTGNNQLDACFVCYFTREAADAGRKLTYTPSQEQGIETISIDKAESRVIYNLQGMPVDPSYKGFAVVGGRKVLLK